MNVKCLLWAYVAVILVGAGCSSSKTDRAYLHERSTGTIRVSGQQVLLEGLGMSQFDGCRGSLEQAGSNAGWSFFLTIVRPAVRPAGRYNVAYQFEAGRNPTPPMGPYTAAVGYCASGCDDLFTTVTFYPASGSLVVDRSADHRLAGSFDADTRCIDNDPGAYCPATREQPFHVDFDFGVASCDEP